MKPKVQRDINSLPVVVDAKVTTVNESVVLQLTTSKPVTGNVSLKVNLYIDEVDGDQASYVTLNGYPCNFSGGQLRKGSLITVSILNNEAELPEDLTDSMQATIWDNTRRYTLTVMDSGIPAAHSVNTTYGKLLDNVLSLPNTTILNLIKKHIDNS